MAEIVFKNVSHEEVVDAFTGGPIEGTVFQCQECHARYGKISVDELVSSNGGRCLACKKKAILAEKVESIESNSIR